jgi:uncharacterized glyoxalase superfamily protein PhnB
VSRKYKTRWPLVRETVGTMNAMNGRHTTDGIPHGSTSLTPHLVVKQAARALDFYRDVLGARVLDVTRFPGADLVAHAELEFSKGKLTLSDPLEAYGLIATDSSKGACFSFALYVNDVDAVTERAVAAGATLREKPATFVSGDRFASILDPFGVRWSLMTRVEDLSPDESRRRVQEWASQQR